MKRTVLILTNSIWYTANFRLNLAKALMRLGFELVAVAPRGTGDQSLLERAGIVYIDLPIDSKGTNPFYDMVYFFRLLMILYRQRPFLCLAFTIKPNIYSGLACQVLKAPSIHNISGLGTAFIETNWITDVVKILYRIALQGSKKVFFQNNEDHDLFIENGLVEPAVTEILPGSGVDTDWFSPIDVVRNQNHRFRFLLSARLLWDKGVGEYVLAARQLLSEGAECDFQLLGFADFANRTAISIEDIRKWEDEGLIKFLGSADDVRPHIAAADCVVLPSYREGTPRALLEAASMCKPIITTDTIGCRNTVDNGTSGFLCKVRDHIDLADKMRKMMELTASQRKTMGLRGRKKMIDEFSEKIVIDKYVNHILCLSRSR